MITLQVEDYCHDCPDFEADVDKASVGAPVWDDVAMKWNYLTLNNTNIYCKHQSRCKAIKEHLEKASKENKKR